MSTYNFVQRLQRTSEAVVRLLLHLFEVAVDLAEVIDEGQLLKRAQQYRPSGVSHDFQGKTRNRHMLSPPADMWNTPKTTNRCHRPSPICVRHTV